jgi:hypothetical protein
MLLIVMVMMLQLLSLVNKLTFFFQNFFIFKGTSKTRVESYIKQVMQVINLYKKDSICLPETANEWLELEKGFFEFGGLPNCYFSIDGSLIMIKRYQKKIIFFFIFFF